VVDQITVEDSKTKALASLMQTMGVKAPALIVVDEIDQNLRLASRNIPLVELVKASDVNVYQLLRYDSVIVNSAGMDQLKARLENKA
jgi:large subunit ribosomal protein L4